MTFTIPKFTYPFNFSSNASTFNNSYSILSSGFGLIIGEKCVNSNKSCVFISNSAHPIVRVETSSPKILGSFLKSDFSDILLKI